MILLLLLFLFIALLFLIISGKQIQRSKIITNEENIDNNWIENIAQTDFFNSQRVNQEERKLVGFYGEMKFSENKKYCVVFQDGDNPNKKGYFTLVDTNKIEILFEKRINRPHDCLVANNGLTICSDWKYWSKSGSCFYVFDISGNIIFDYKTSENIGDLVDIDILGTVACFDLCLSNELIIIDLINKQVSLRIPKDYTTGIELNLNNRNVLLKYNDDEDKRINF